MFDKPIIPNESIPSEFFVWPLVSIFGCNIILGIIVQIFGKKDNSWIDAWWSLSFLIPNVVVLIIRASKGYPYDSISGRMWLITSCVAIWALRLSSYIFRRHKREDYRYKDMRERWTEQGTVVYYLKAFGFIYIGQGIFSLINNAGPLFVNIWSVGFKPEIDMTTFKFKTDYTLTVFDFLGAAVWAAGFAIEVASDYQLASHLANPRPGTGKFIKSGLWRYSRHPNYFGEAVMWWGIWLIALNMDYGWVTIYAPIFITTFLRFVSGVPFPEKKYANNPEW